MTEMRKWTQFVSGIIVSIGGFVLGVMMGWSSPAQSKVKSDLINNDDFKWIASIMPLGAALSQILTAVLMDLIGRKWCIVTLSFSVVPGWIILLCCKTFVGYLLGRLLLGFFAGGTCVVCPTYIAEISHKSIRGFLGTFFQLFMILGILYSYSFGYVKKIFYLNITSLIFPILLGCGMMFLPQTPVFLLKKSREEKARKVLTHFRGPNYDIEEEIEEMKLLVMKDDTSLWNNIKKKESLRGFLMLLGLNMIQELCGGNAVLFYAHKIFKFTGTDIDEKLSVILLGLMQVLSLAIPIATIDRIGRKILWYISLSIMAICEIILGMYFTIHAANKSLGHSLSAVPTIAVCLYILGYSCGAGPLPWVTTGEVLPTRVKAVLGPFCVFVNWMLTFIITFTFPILVNSIGIDWVCYIYASFCILALVFIFFFVVETKNKSLEEIQEILRGKPKTNTESSEL